jgi:hypothetical protein
MGIDLSGITTDWAHGTVGDGKFTNKRTVKVIYWQTGKTSWEKFQCNLPGRKLYTRTLLFDVRKHNIRLGL